MNMNTEKEGKQYREHIDSLKIRAPEGLEESVLSFIEGKRGAGNRFITIISSAAAVVLIILSTVLFISERAPAMDYGDKLSALVEAYKLFPESEDEIAEEDIIYEDESLIIYLK